ncbi:MAG: 2-amino-4-hydroxy-6-hydroxymethyldihydropteridine diphosphokinase [Pseudomonadota bacterium]
MEHTVFIGLGSNQGEKIRNCEQACDEILKLNGFSLVAQSSWYRTEPWGRNDQEWFINGVIQLKTGLPPHELLKHCKEIELRLGRKDNGRWGPRPIDIDLLFYDHLTMTSPDLEIPHPRIHHRKFVLIPMAEIAPQLIHPVFKNDIKHLLDNVSDQNKVIKFMD